MNRECERLLHWPSLRHFGYTLLLSLGVTAWFALVYGGASYLTARRALRVRVHLDAELAVPLVPAAVLGYVSIYALFSLPPFVLRTRREVQALALTLLAVILVAGVGFLLFPAEPAYPPHEHVGAWTGLFQFAETMALKYNMVPSLHVAMSVVFTAAFAERTGMRGKVFLWTWAVVIALSTLLAHEHHVIDVVTGFALGAAGYALVYRRWRAREIPPPSPAADRVLSV
jgi:membrane-associated phospholipid phosphatase